MSNALERIFNIISVFYFFPPLACEKAAGSSLWIYIFVGNMLRGIGETPIMPLGVSYLDDFSSEENSPFYLGELLFTSYCLL